MLSKWSEVYSKKYVFLMDLDQIRIGHVGPLPCSGIAPSRLALVRVTEETEFHNTCLSSAGWDWAELGLFFGKSRSMREGTSCPSEHISSGIYTQWLIMDRVRHN